jgi:hypothetical protein
MTNLICNAAAETVSRHHGRDFVRLQRTPERQSSQPPSCPEFTDGGVPLKDKDSNANHHLEVQAFLILERVAGSESFEVSVLLRADGRFIGKSSMGTVAEGQEILLSLRWDQPRQRFVASSRAAGSEPILSFIPFVSPGAAHDAMIPPEFLMEKSFVLNSSRNSATEAHESKR